MIREDDRTDEQRKTHTLLIIGTDRFMSGWGYAKDGASYAAWACHPDNRNRVWDWVARRGDQMRVRDAIDGNGNTYKPDPCLCAHLHIYVVTEGHPALR